MDRRKVLLVVAAVIAALGTLLVFLYVRGADTRADSRYDAVTVLRATKAIAAGETVEAAQAAGKIGSSAVSRKDVLSGALTALDGIQGQVATAPIYPGEQLIGSKFGATGAASSGLTIPKGSIAISVDVPDPALSAGFLKPGDKVAIFMKGDSFTRLLLPNVQVIGVGATTIASAATTDAAGAPTTPASSSTLTLAVSQPQAERVLFAKANGDLSVGLLNNDSQVATSGGVTTDNLFR